MQALHAQSDRKVIMDVIRQKYCKYADSIVKVKPASFRISSSNDYSISVISASMS